MLLLLWRAEIPPAPFSWLLVVPLLASAYGFSRVDAKTDDGYFLGFPSYWNIVAFYLYVLRVPMAASVSLIAVCAVLTFVRTPYVYSTRGGPLAKTMNTGAVIYFVMIGFVLLGPAKEANAAAMISLIYPTLYLALSGAVTVRRRRRPLQR